MKCGYTPPFLFNKLSPKVIVALLTGHIFCGIFTSKGAVFDVCGCLLASARTALPDEVSSPFHFV
jgi:hypothetical protein